MEISNNNALSKISKSETQNYQKQYANLIYGYNAFVENMNKSDFCNSPNRYITEHTLIRSIIKLCQEKGLEDNLGDWLLKQIEVTKKLKEFGIRLK